MADQMLEYKGYYAKIYFDARDDIFVGVKFVLEFNIIFSRLLPILVWVRRLESEF